MALTSPKRLLSSVLALGIAASAFTVLPAANASAAPARANYGVEEGLTVNPHFDRDYYEQRRQAANQVSAEVPNLETKTHEAVRFDLKPYIKNADNYTVIVRGLPQGLSYDIENRTISGSTPWEGSYDVSVFLKGRRDKHLQSFTLTVGNHNNPADYPRNTDNPNLNRLPHLRR